MQHSCRKLLLGAAWGLAVATTDTVAQESTQLQTVTVTGAADGAMATEASTATKTDTPLTETPQSISVITADEIAAHGASSMMEALRYTAGAAVETYGPDGRGYDWVKLRGFDTFPSQFRDGMRMFNYDFMEPYGLERIEVLRGPSSVLYGQSVPGGLINGVSKLPLRTAQREVELSAGSFGALQGQFDFTGPALHDGALDYRLIGLLHEGGNQIEFPDGHGYPARRQYFAPSLTWRPAADTRITVLAERLHVAGMFPNLASAPDGGPTEVVIDDRGYDADITKLWNVGWQVDQGLAGGALVFHHKLRFNHRDEAQPYLSALGYNTPDQPTLLDRYASSYFSGASSWVTDNTLEWTTHTGAVAHTLLAGVDYGSNHYHDDYYYGDAPPLDIAHPVYGQNIPLPTEEQSGTRQYQSQLGVYLQDQAYWQQWIVTASLRRDWARDRNSDPVSGTPTQQFNAAFSGRVGLMWKSALGVTPYLSWSQSFQPNSGTDFDGKPFSPTRGRQYEVGAKYATPGDRAIYTVSFFRLLQDNVLTKDPAHENFSTQTGQVRSQGVELEGKGQLTRTLELSAAYTWNPVKVTRSNDVDLGKVPILTPQTNASLWLSHTTREGWLEGLGLSAGVRHLGATWGDTENTLRNTQLTLMDLAARYPLRGFELGLNLNNVFDRTSFMATPYGNYLTAKRVIAGSLRYQW